MSDKVINGTPQGSKTLCLNCRMGHVINGLNFQQVIYCRANNQPIPMQFPVYVCSIFDDKHRPSLYMMEQIAWDITSRNRGTMGFQSGDKLEVTITPPSQRNPNQPLPPVTGEKHE